jgi:oligopeptide transport system substrate-binding protein
MLAGRFIRYTYNKAYTVPPNVVTNGPYVLTKWDFKRRLLLEKSPTYWDRDNVRTDSIQMDVIDGAAGQLLAYETGQVQWHADVAPEQAAELKAKGRTDLHTSPAFGTAFLSVLCTPKLPASIGGGPNPCNDVRVRQALAMSIDKNFIVTNLTRMDELPARTYLPPDGTLPKFTWMPGLFDEGRRDSYGFKEMQQRLRSPDALTGPGPGLPYDIKKARQLLAEAGFPDGKDFARLPLLYNTENFLRRDICMTLQSQWKKALNIDVEIKPLEGKIFQKQTHSKDYWIATTAWYGDYPDVSTFTDKYTSKSLQNDSGWINKKYDDLCDQATREPDELKRTALLSAAEHMIDTEVPIIPMYHYVNVTLSPSWVHGVEPNPRNVTVFKGVWLDKDRGGTKR